MSSPAWKLFWFGLTFTVGCSKAAPTPNASPGADAAAGAVAPSVAGAAIPALAKENWPCRSENRMSAGTIVTEFDYTGSPARCTFPAGEWRPGCPVQERITNPHGKTGIGQLTYDAKGYLVKQVDPMGYADGPFTYHDDGRVTTEFSEARRQGNEVTVLALADNVIGLRMVLDAEQRPAITTLYAVDGASKGRAVLTSRWQFEAGRLVTFTNDGGDAIHYQYDCK